MLLSIMNLDRDTRNLQNSAPKLEQGIVFEFEKEHINMRDVYGELSSGDHVIIGFEGVKGWNSVSIDYYQAQAGHKIFTGKRKSDRITIARRGDTVYETYPHRNDNCWNDGFLNQMTNPFHPMNMLNPHSHFYTDGYASDRGFNFDDTNSGIPQSTFGDLFEKSDDKGSSSFGDIQSDGGRDSAFDGNGGVFGDGGTESKFGDMSSDKEPGAY